MTDPSTTILEDFLRTELRDSRRRCETLLARIADVTAGRIGETEMTGNLYRVTISLDAARIDHLFDPSCNLNMTTGGLVHAIAVWRDDQGR